MPSAARGSAMCNANIQTMHRTVVPVLLALLFRSLAVQADEIDVPELGVHLAGMPSAATKPQVSEATQYPAGYSALVRLGTAELNIFREEEPIPSGSDVAEPAYRATLDRRYHGNVESKTLGAPTSVGGHNAWTVVDARGGSGDITRYTCLTYVIVERHLYRLAVTADGSPARPPEFDALVKALSGVSFEPVQRASPHG